MAAFRALIVVLVVAVGVSWANATDRKTLNDAVKQGSFTVLLTGRVGSGRSRILERLLGYARGTLSASALKHAAAPVAHPKLLSFHDEKAGHDLNFIEVPGFGFRSDVADAVLALAAVDDSVALAEETCAPMKRVYYVVDARERDLDRLPGNLTALCMACGPRIAKRFTFVINKMDLKLQDNEPCEDTTELLTALLTAFHETFRSQERCKVLFVSAEISNLEKGLRENQPIDRTTPSDPEQTAYSLQQLIDDVYEANTTVEECLLQLDPSDLVEIRNAAASSSRKKRVSLILWRTQLMETLGYRGLHASILSKELELRKAKSKNQAILGYTVEAVAALFVAFRFAETVLKTTVAGYRVVRTARSLNLAFTLLTTLASVRDFTPEKLQEMSQSSLNTSLHEALADIETISAEIHYLEQYVS